MTAIFQLLPVFHIDRLIDLHNDAWFVFEIMLDFLLFFWPGWLLDSNHNPPIASSQAAGNTVMSHCTWQMLDFLKPVIGLAEWFQWDSACHQA
jgi:hypothetical protein